MYCDVYGWYTPPIRRVLVRKIGFITHRQYNAISDINILHFTAAHALGFFVSTSRLLATDLNTGIITVSLNQTLHILHIKPSLLRRTPHNSRRELTSSVCLLTRIHWELNFSFSYKPLIRHVGNAPSNGASTVSSLLKRVTSQLMRSRDPSSLLRHPNVYSCCLATRDVFTSALRSNGSGATLTAPKTPLSSTVCVIAGICFEVTILAWRKYVTLLPL
jgi:hypothetical protein